MPDTDPKHQPVPPSGAMPDYEPRKIVTPAERLAEENVINPVAPTEHRSIAEVTKELVEQRDEVRSVD